VIWQVTLDIFSGRPNPIWQIEGAEAEDLARRLRAAPPVPPAAATPAPPPDLGYRGFVLRLGPTGKPDKETRVYHGRIIGAEGERLDPGRQLERWLLASAGDRLERPVFEHVLHSVDGQV
jgi:hypothetical protein